MQGKEARERQEHLRVRLDERFRGPLMSYFLRRVRDRAEAEDLTQEVFVRLIASEEADRLDQAPAFIFKIAANLLRDRARRNSYWRFSDAPPTDSDITDDLIRELVEDRGPERVLEGKETLADVLRTLSELGDRTRDMFILFRLENMKQRDIANHFGVTQSAVEKHVAKAVMHLALRYGEPL